jgi:subtilase family serine protease
VQKQNPDGGFGNSPSTVYDTAMAILALKELNVVSDIIGNGVNYILDLQSEDGSWYESPYQTALAVRSVSRAIVEPDLSVTPGDISFIPATLSALPANIVVNAAVRNLGKTDVAQATVALYAGAVSEETRIAEQTLAFPGQSETVVTFSAAVTASNETRFYVAVDPEGAVDESNEQNNSAYQPLAFEPTYDLNISDTAVLLSQGSVDAFEDVTIQADLSNQGTVNGYNVQVTYQVQTTDGLLLIGTNTVDILAGQTIQDQMIWRTNRAGENMPILVSLDPLDAVSETSETNNQAGTVITVHPATEPNLTIAFEDISLTPNPAHQGGDVGIAAVVRNEGFSGRSDQRIGGLDKYSRGR